MRCCCFCGVVCFWVGGKKGRRRRSGEECVEPLRLSFHSSALDECVSFCRVVDLCVFFFLLSSTTSVCIRLCV